MKQVMTVVALSFAILACGKDEGEKPRVQTVAVERRDIVVDAQATGVVEPINVVEVKSKAGGQIVRMPVETGSQVKPGDLLVQVDTRDVRNQYDQSLADVRAAEARLAVEEAQRKRSDDLFQQRIITAQEHETAALNFANAQAQLVRARASLDLSQQRLEDATVRAPIAGTVIDKTVSLGQVITSATGAFGGGTTLLKMADLSQVRVRAMVNETDIGNVKAGQQATVIVDAYPTRPFQGTVEKIEPQAVVQQSVTMFPVLVSVSNRDRLLMPGMNGEVSILIDRKENVLAVQNDAVRSPREAIAAGTAIGLDTAFVQEKLRGQFGGGGGGAGGASTGGATQGTRRGDAVRVEVSRGDVALPQEQGMQQAGGRQQMQVTPEQCQQVRAALAKKPQSAVQLAAIRGRVRSGVIDMQQARNESQAIYADLGVDPRIARPCMMTAGGGGGEAATVQNAEQSLPGRQPSGNTPPAIQMGPGEAPRATPARGRPGLVFVADSNTFLPRIVRLGVSNFDYTEVVSGLKEGDQVALVASAVMQAQRQQSLDRFRNMTGGGGVPGMQQQPAGGTGGQRVPGGGGRP
ncbi:MAG: efflux RND transporter periplasmic adaptor subunit [Gemmatimonadaceae bacterium]